MRSIVILLVVFLLLAGMLVWVVPQSLFLSGLVEHMCPGVVPAGRYAHNLDSSNPDLVRESLAHLRRRKDGAGVPRALQLLSSGDDYIWLNAALYTGVCGRQEAVPYLIKALRHTAWRSDEETVQFLHSLTGQDFGIDFQCWQAWWKAKYPDATFDWTSHLGFSPRMLNTEKERPLVPTPPPVTPAADAPVSPAAAAAQL